MPLLEQDLLQDRYLVVRSIKSGGMGAVYEAIDKKLADTPCAIKEVLASALQGPDAQYILQSFDSEVRSLATLEHPNIPRVRDYFEIGQTRYIVLDLVQGQALDEELAEHLRVTGEPMDPHLAAQDMIAVLETLDYLHTQRPPIIHRDIKPANLIRDRKTGKLKLVDFGIARSAETQRPQTQVGTPGFCAPEQMSGRAEPRSDLYSVGATLYHLCSGEKPPAFSFEPLELPVAGLAQIVRKATAMRVGERYVNAREMSDALRDWLHSQQVKARTAPLVVEKPRSDRSLYPLLVLLFGLLGGFLLWVRSQAVAPPPASPSPRVAPAVAVVVPTRTPPPIVERVQSVKVVVPKPRRAVRKARPKSPPPEEIVVPSLPEESYPSGTRSAYRPPPQAQQPEPSPLPASDEFQLRRRRSDGEEYVRTIDGHEVTIITRHFPGQSANRIWDGPAMANIRQQPGYQPFPERGCCATSPARGYHQGWHALDGVLFDIQVRPAAMPPNILSEVDRFMHSYSHR